jgi:hypothetical protein
MTLGSWRPCFAKNGRIILYMLLMVLVPGNEAATVRTNPQGWRLAFVRMVSNAPLDLTCSLTPKYGCLSAHLLTKIRGYHV